MRTLKIFEQENCPTCKKLKIELAENKKENMNINSYFSNFNNKIEFQKYNIVTTPTIILVDEKGSEIDRFYGYKTFDKIESFYFQD